MTEYDRTSIPTPKTTREAVKKKCLDCMGGETERIKECPIADCILWPHRFGIPPVTARKRGLEVGEATENLTMKTVYAECVYCMGGGVDAREYVKDCNDTDCGLYPLRMGRR